MVAPPIFDLAARSRPAWDDDLALAARPRLAWTDDDGIAGIAYRGRRRRPGREWVLRSGAAARPSRSRARGRACRAACHVAAGGALRGPPPPASVSPARGC